MGPYGFDLGHWGVELAAGRDISCSLPPERPIQILDSRDLAEFALRLIESGVDGAVNAVGLELSIREVADAWVGCVPGARVNWVGDGDDLGLSPDEPADTFRLANVRAVEAGLRWRPAEQTARDYIAWIRAGGTPPPLPH
jgi:2'-hydroxyisoflavone reductase